MPVIEITNLSPDLSQDQIDSLVREFVKAFSLDLSGHKLEITFSTSDEIRLYNKQYRNIDRSTDVLSFPQAPQPHSEPIWGSIIISPQDALEREEELSDLIKHGLLHLAGYDHESDPEGWATAANKINHMMGIECKD